MKHCVSLAYGLGRMAIVLVILGVALAGCNLPLPLPLGGTKSGESGATPGLATEQSALSASPGSGKPDMNCQKDGPWFFYVDEQYTMLAGGTNATIKVEGYVSLNMDRAGKVTAGATDALGAFDMTGKDSHFYATWKFAPRITGTCQGGVMKLSVVESLGENGVIQGPYQYEDKIEQWSFPVPGTMKHDLTFPLTKNKLGGEVEIWWGILGTPGYKKWGVHNFIVVPLVEPPTGTVP